MQINVDVASAQKADENMNRTVAVLLKMNLSQEKLSEGIRLAVKDANEAKRRLHGSTLCTPSSTVCRQDSAVSCSSESNLSGNYSSEGELYEARTSKSKNGRRKRKPRTKNINTPAARLAKKICTEFLFSRRVWTALYDGNNRLSDFRLDVVLKQIAPKMTEAERHLLKDERSEVTSRIKRVLALGKSYRIKRAKTGNAVPKAPMEHIINVIDLSGEGSSLDEIEKEVSDAVTADAPGRAAIARRKLFDANKDKTNSKAKSKKDKQQLAKEFKARLDNARKRPAPLATAKTRRTSKSKRSKKNVVATTDEVVTTSVSKKNQDDVQTTTRRTRSSKRKAARSARSKIASCSEEEAREDSNADSDPDPGENVTGKTESSPELTLKVGAKASGMWRGPENKGDWYSGKIISIDNSKKTVRMRFDDGDEDPDLSWSHLILQ